MLRVWDLTTGQPIGEPLTGHTGQIWAVATGVLQDGRTIAVSGGDDGVVRLWDLTTGQPIVVVPAHRGAVTCVAVTDLPTAVGPVMLTGGHDGSVKAWTVATLIENQAIGVDEVFAGENTGVRPAVASRVGQSRCRAAEAAHRR